MRISGMGTATPDRDLDQATIAELVAGLQDVAEEDRRTLRALYRRSGVRRRGSVLLEAGPEGPAVPFYAKAPGTRARMAAYEHHAAPLAAAAARRALRDADLEAREVTHLVTASCTGFAAPGVDLELFPAIGLRPTTERTHVGFMGCHGALNAARVAAALVAADPARHVLLVAVELPTIHFGKRFDPELAVSEAIFADGAAALAGDGGEGPFRVVASGSRVFPDSAEAMSWRVGDEGFRMGLSARVPDLIGTELRPWLSGWLDDHGLALADVGSWAVHPGGPRIVRATEEALGLDREATAASREVLARHGNMSSPTILFVLERMRSADAPLPLVALAFGPGLAAEAMLVR